MLIKVNKEDEIAAVTPIVKDEDEEEAGKDEGDATGEEPPAAATEEPGKMWNENCKNCINNKTVIMKKVILLLAVAICSMPVWAQKGKVSTAEFELQSGNILKAKQAIDEAVVHEKLLVTLRHGR